MISSFLEKNKSRPVDQTDQALSKWIYQLQHITTLIYSLKERIVKGNYCLPEKREISVLKTSEGISFTPRVARQPTIPTVSPILLNHKATQRKARKRVFREVSSVITFFVPLRIIFGREVQFR